MLIFIFITRPYAYGVLISRSDQSRYPLRPTAIARHLRDQQTSIDIQRQVHQYVKHFPPSCKQYILLMSFPETINSS